MPENQEVLEEKKKYLQWTIENADKLTDDELHDIINIFYGYNIPRNAVCEGHDAPFDFVADAFFERNSNVIVLANRNGGKTQNFGIINGMDIKYKGCEVVSVGAIEEQARKCYAYTSQIMKKEAVSDYLETNLMSKTTTTTGGELKILPGTMAAVNGPHPEKANLDEVELMPWHVLQEAMSMPKSSDKAKAALRITSTRKFSYGPMQRLLDEAEKRGLKIYQWCIWETIEPCTDERSGTVPVTLDYLPYGARDVSERRQETVYTHDEALRGQTVKLEDIKPHSETGKYSGCLNCPLAEVCLTKAKRSDGYYAIDDAIARFQQLDRETWAAQWECQKPGREGLIYPMFSEENVKEFEIDPSWRIYAGQDFGFTNPSVALYVAVDPEENVYIFDEDYDTQTAMTTLAENKYKDKVQEYGVREWYCDPSGADQIATMNLFNVPAVPAHTNNIDAGIRVTRYFILTPKGERKLFVHPRCKNLIKDMDTYHYKEGTDKPEKDKPDSGDHGPDALRYVLVSLFPHLLETSGGGDIDDWSFAPYPDFERVPVDAFTTMFGGGVEDDEFVF